MRVHFVGCGDAFGSGGRWQTCIGVESEGQLTLVDCGATSLAALKAYGLDPGAVDAVVVTHLHGDHFGGLPFLILDGQFSRRTRTLRVLGPPGTGDRLRAAMEVFFPGSTAVTRRFTVEVTELVPGGEPVDVGSMRVRGWEVVHASGAPPMAVRIDDGRSSFAYSGDTEWTPVLIDAARGAGLFAVEAYTYDKPVRYHLDYQTVRAHLTELHAAQVVLTHMSAPMLARLAEVDLVAAEDGMTFDV